MTSNSSNLNPFLLQCQKRIAVELEKHLPPITTIPKRLHQAMHYSVLNGGKRLRPLLVYATGNAMNVPIEQLDAPAIAVELIHCYSLVHDDLPAMDDDDLRRNQPTCHKAFDEATAILVGDALQSLAFEALPTIEMVKVLAQASGSLGMAGGQDLDLAAEGQRHEDLALLEKTHQMKTGALIKASVEMGAMAAGADETSKHHLIQFANHIGLAFQIQDDILDVEGDTTSLGKTAGIDVTNNKATYTSILGVNEAKKQLRKQYELSMSHLEKLSFAAEDLQLLCQYIVQRTV